MAARIQYARMLSIRSVAILLTTLMPIACIGAVDDSNQPSQAASPVPSTDLGTDPPTGPEPSGEGESEDPYFAGPTETAPSDPDPTTPPQQQLVEEASRELAAMKVTSYEHTTTVDEASGTFRFDCSGFVGYALSRVLPSRLEAVKAFSAVARPLAKHYEAFFASLSSAAPKAGWRRIDRAVDLQAGDVIAWLKPADLVSNNTGHIMIVRGRPTVNPKRADEIVITVIDATASFHGPTDTRAPSSSGLGSGPIGIIVDGKGAPLRYRWTGTYSTKEYTTAITFARPQ